MPSPIARQRMTTPLRMVDNFDALSSRWAVESGTFSVVGGALRASALADWLGNLVTNGEFTMDTAGWTAFDTALSRVDSAVDPGAASGGADSWCLKSQITAALGRASQAITWLSGVRYGYSARLYSPSSNVYVNGATLWLYPTVLVSTTMEDVWQIKSGTTVANATSGGPFLRNNSTTIGDIAYFDSIFVYRQAAALTAQFGPNCVITRDLPNPAAPDVTPFGTLARYTDGSNTWEVRAKPNTLGADLDLIQIVAGVETVRATADVDWTASATDLLRIGLSGPAINLWSKKSGATVWTLSATYGAATTGLAARKHGILAYKTGADLVGRFEVTA